MAAVPVMTFFVALWLLAFYFMKAGKLVNYISAPVMGGFITGICTTIILMQIPKVMGGTSGTGEFFELAEHIYKTALNINMPSVIMGVDSSGNIVGFKEDNAKISNGSSFNVCGYDFHNKSSNKRLGN
ncbi:MAG: SulP family inorganic anion transporter [Eubacterium ventriosum]